MNRGFLRSTVVAGLALTALAAAAPADPVASMPVELLKRAYLDCERAAQAGHLASGDVQTCATIYEALKARGFGGDFRALRDWYLGKSAERSRTCVVAWCSPGAGPPVRNAASGGMMTALPARVLVLVALEATRTGASPRPGSRSGEGPGVCRSVARHCPPHGSRRRPDRPAAVPPQCPLHRPPQASRECDAGLDGVH
jgi:hypothetical protein